MVSDVKDFSAVHLAKISFSVLGLAYKQNPSSTTNCPLVLIRKSWLPPIPWHPSIPIVAWVGSFWAPLVSKQSSESTDRIFIQKKKREQIKTSLIFKNVTYDKRVIYKRRVNTVFVNCHFESLFIRYILDLM